MIKNELMLTNSSSTTLDNPLEKIREIPEEILWLENLKSEQSNKTYSKALQQFMTFLRITTVEELRSIDHGHIIAFRQQLKKENKSPRTINNRLSALSSLFDHLIDRQKVAANPVKGVKRLNINQSQVSCKLLTKQEARQMLDAPLLLLEPDESLRKRGCYKISELQMLRDRAILGVFFYTGCRISEICSLKIKDNRLEASFHILDFVVKGGKRNRVAINPELQDLLEQYIQFQGHKEDKDSPLFLPIRNGLNQRRHLQRRQLDRLWNKYEELIHLSDSSPHSARTTFITEALNNNCDVVAVKNTVGHADIRTTLIYDQREHKYRDSASFSVRF